MHSTGGLTVITLLLITMYIRPIEVRAPRSLLRSDFITVVISLELGDLPRQLHTGADRRHSTCTFNLSKHVPPGLYVFITLPI